MTAISQQIAPRSVMPLGMFEGYDTVISQVRQTAVAGTTASGRAVTNSFVAVCTTATDLATSIGIDASASVSSVFESVSDKLQFFNSLNVTTYDVSVVVYVSHSTGQTSCSAVALAPEVDAPTAQNIGAFVASYGDSFVSSVTMGGEYVAVYKLHAETQTDQTNITNTLSAQGIVGGVTLSATLQTAISNYYRSSTTSSTFTTYISGIKNPDTPDLSQMIDFAQSFASRNPDSPVVVAFETQGYESVAGLSSVFSPVAANRAFFTGSIAKPGLLAKLLQLSEISNEIGILQAIYADYAYTGDPMAPFLAKVQIDIGAIKNLVEAYEGNPAGAVPEVPALPSFAQGTPALNVTYSTQGPWGGPGGNPFDDVNLATAFATLTGISQITIRSGSRIDALKVTYQSGSQPPSSQQVHGGSGGSDQVPALQLVNGAYIKSVTGFAAERVGQLTITLSDGNSTKGGAADGTGLNPSYISKEYPLAEFIWNAQTGDRVLGFFGRSGSALDQFGLRIATFSPATWTAQS